MLIALTILPTGQYGRRTALTISHFFFFENEGVSDGFSERFVAIGIFLKNLFLRGYLYVIFEADAL